MSAACNHFCRKNQTQYNDGCPKKDDRVKSFWTKIEVPKGGNGDKKAQQNTKSNHARSVKTQFALLLAKSCLLPAKLGLLLANPTVVRATEAADVQPNPAEIANL